MQRFIERASRDGGDWDVEHRLLLPDGAVKSLHVVVHAVRDEAGVLSFVGAVMDVTAAKRAEEAVQAAQAELAHVARMTTLGELMAWIAHEVNQPARGHRHQWNGLPAMARPKSPALDEARSSVEDMISDAQRAGDVILEIRALSRKTAPKRAPLDINDLDQGVVRLVAREAQAHGASVRLNLAPALPAVVGDRVQLQQVVINLVINAIQAMASVTAGPRELRSGRGGTKPVMCSSRSGIPATALGRTTQTSCSKPSSQPSPPAWGWDCRSAGRYRGAWRQRMGDGEHAQRRRLPFHAAGGMKADGARSGSESGGCDETLQFDQVKRCIYAARATVLGNLFATLITRSSHALPWTSGLQHFKCAGNQRIDTIFDIRLPVEHLDVGGNAYAFVAHHVSRKVRLVRQTIFPTIREFFLKLI